MKDEICTGNRIGEVKIGNYTDTVSSGIYEMFEITKISICLCCDSYHKHEGKSYCIVSKEPKIPTPRLELI